MKGSIRQHSCGNWELQYDGPRGADGRRKQITRTGPGRRKDAERVPRDLLAKLEHGAYATNTRFPLQFVARDGGKCTEW